MGILRGVREMVPTERSAVRSQSSWGTVRGVAVAISVWESAAFARFRFPAQLEVLSFEFQRICRPNKKNSTEEGGGCIGYRYLYTMVYTHSISYTMVYNTMVCAYIYHGIYIMYYMICDILRYIVPWYIVGTYIPGTYVVYTMVVVCKSQRECLD